MATVIFYEKPGCASNARQKSMLANAGHHVVARNLLSEPWTADRLREFLQGKAVTEWLNLNSPRVKSKEIDPGSLDEATALQMMLQDPLLIRRPLIQVDGRHDIGFDPQRIHAWIGLFSPATDSPPAEDAPQQDWEYCSRRHAVSPCGDGMGEVGK